MAKILENIEKLPDNTVIFYGLFAMDIEGNFFEYDESMSLVSKYANVPIYGGWDFNLGHGIVGGKLVCGFHQGHTAAKIALDILNGKNISEIPLVTESPNSYIFDYNQLKKNNISLKSLPEGSAFINKPEPFYQSPVFIIALLGLSLFSFIMFLIYYAVNNTKKKKIRLALNNTKEKLIAFFDQTFQFIALLDPSGILLEINKSGLNLMNTDEDSVINKPFYNLPFFENSDEIHKKINNTTKECQKVEMSTIEISITNENGEKKYINFSFKPICDRNNNIKYILVEGNDITNIKLSQQALMSKEQQLRDIIDLVPDMIYVKDYNGRFIMVNKALAAFFDKSVAEITGKFDKDLIDDENILKKTSDDERSVIESKKTSFKEYAYHDKNNEIKYLRTITIPYRIADINEDLLLGIAIDITEEKLIEESLKESEERYRKFFTDTGIAMIVVDYNKTVLMCNKMFEELSEFSPNEVEGKMSWTEFIHPDDLEFMIENNRKRLSGDQGAIDDYFFRMITKNKSEKYVRMSVSNIASSKQLIVSLIDITRQMIAERELNRYKENLETTIAIRTKELQELNQELLDKNEEFERMINVTSHDLRSPLINIQGFSRELERSFENMEKILDNEDPDKEKIREIIDDDIALSLRFVKAGVEKMDALLGGLLKLSRFGSVQISPSTIDMNTLIKKVIDNFAFEINRSQIDVDISELPESFADPEQINQLFSNLIGNAIKYLDPSRKGKIKISGIMIGDLSEYCIEDNGIGISKNHHKKIFEIFYQLDRKSDGLGLGMSIVSKIIERNHGNIRIDSEEGIGSKFYISLPATNKNYS